MTIFIREANENDIAAIFDVRTSVLENHLSVDQLIARGITPVAIRDALQEEPCIWVADCGAKIVGFSMSNSDDACIFAVFVRPEFEGRGIGRLLMESAEEFLFERHSSIWLETESTSRAAGFYEKLGWVRSQTLADGDVRFEKQLSPSLA
jgi:ribosomal protein S18 acetylase RimI-like enzyme